MNAIIHPVSDHEIQIVHEDGRLIASILLDETGAMLTLGGNKLGNSTILMDASEQTVIFTNQKDKITILNHDNTKHIAQIFRDATGAILMLGGDKLGNSTILMDSSEQSVIFTNHKDKLTVLNHLNNKIIASFTPDSAILAGHNILTEIQQLQSKVNNLEVKLGQARNELGNSINSTDQRLSRHMVNHP